MFIGQCTEEFGYIIDIWKYHVNSQDDLEGVVQDTTGDVIFKLRKKSNEVQGNCYESFQIENGDEIDILSTNKSVYGYLSISGEFDLKLQWGSSSINTKANIGSNDGIFLKTEY